MVAAKRFHRGTSGTKSENVPPGALCECGPKNVSPGARERENGKCFPGGPLRILGARAEKCFYGPPDSPRWNIFLFHRWPDLPAFTL